ncbi:MAG: porin family protein [Solirubrobacteraceae bacterium]
MFVALCSVTLYAQDISFGAKAGVNLSKFNNFYYYNKNTELILSELTGGKTSNSFKNSMEIGAVGGLYANIGLNEDLSLQIELLFSKIRNNNVSTIEGTYEDFDPETDEFILVPFNTTNKTNITLNYLALPVMLEYYVFRGLYLEAGPQFNFKINSMVSFENEASENLLIQTPTNLKKELSNYKEFDLGFNLGLGYRTSFGLNFNARYNFSGVTFLTNNSDIENRNLQFTLGYDIINPN